MRRRILAVRIASAATIAVAFGGLVAIAPLQQQGADAAAATSSAVEIAWTDTTATAMTAKPERNTASAHYNDFKSLKVKVAQTANLIDQAVRVSVSGFSATIASSAAGGGVAVDNARNFVQAMQCWGDPNDAKFYETCQWGGRYGVEANGLGESVYNDVAARVGPNDLAPLGSPGASTYDVPFRTVDGSSFSGRQVLNSDGIVSYPVQSVIGPSTTNEVVSARINADGTGFFDFEMQSSRQAPQLGCGTAEHLRCWLVVVPRGSHFGGDGFECSGAPDTRNESKPFTKGQANALQGGSPVNPKCDYWDNRIVVPIDFNLTKNTCAVGSTETRIVGSQLMIGAMTSWQPALCATTEQTFSLATNPDSIARSQLLDDSDNTPVVAFSGYPVSSNELTEDYERDAFGKTRFTYAPVAVSSVVIAFYAESPTGRQQKLTMSPLLMAKLLTQSYKFTVPTNSSSTEKSAKHLGAVNQSYTYITQDPDFIALNPTSGAFFSVNPSIILPGPSGADAIRQVWRWIFSDKAAVDFMNGVADPAKPNAMTVNPYYLASGNVKATVPWYYNDQMQPLSVAVPRTVGLTNLDGTPKVLTTEALDYFPKNDESVVPYELTNGITSRFDTLAYAPYSETFLSAARQAFRADPASRSRWDGTIKNGGGADGAWVTSGAQTPGSKFMIAITDSVSAQRYGLDIAGVQLPNSTTVVKPDTTTMGNALSALEATSLDTIKQVNPAKVGETGYPMTIVTYAGVNLTKSTSDQRKTVTAMLKQVTTTGQVSGSGVGELPVGYLPLTADLTAQAKVSIAEIQAYVPPPAQSSNNGPAQDEYNAESNFGSDGGTSNAGGTNPVVTADADSISESRTTAAFAEPFARSSLVIALVIGLLGFLIAPVLFRGRGLR